MKIGFHASHEQWPPSALLRQVRRAEQAGFAAAMCSDHFHPWLREQGNSGFAWSWLGAALATTKLTFGTVNAPGYRYQPAVIAQAAATLAEMYPGRFWVAAGSGEALNEHITGEPWPGKADRNARLQECVEIWRALWRGEEVDHLGNVRVARARLYSLPAKPPLIFGAALSEETARWMGGWTDGLITAGKEADKIKNVVEAYRAGGGEGKPVLLQTVVALADTYHEALRIGHREWRQGGVGLSQLADLATVEDFQAAAEKVTLSDAEQIVRASTDAGPQLEWLAADRELGIDTVYVHYLGRDPERFFDIFGSAVLPRFNRD